MNVRLPVNSIKDLLILMKDGAALTLETTYRPEFRRFEDVYVLSKDGKQIQVFARSISSAIHAGKIRSISGTKPLRYEIRPRK